jgi:hypothetical protein
MRMRMRKKTTKSSRFPCPSRRVTSVLEKEIGESLMPTPVNETNQRINRIKGLLNTFSKDMFNTTPVGMKDVKLEICQVSNRGIPAVRGVVTNMQGEYIAEAWVTARNPRGKSYREEVTTAHGRFAFQDMVAGDWEFLVEEDKDTRVSPHVPGVETLASRAEDILENMPTCGAIVFCLPDKSDVQAIDTDMNYFTLDEDVEKQLTAGRVVAGFITGRSTALPPDSRTLSSSRCLTMRRSTPEPLGGKRGQHSKSSIR